MGVHFMGVYLMGVHLMGVYFIGMYLMDVHLMCTCGVQFYLSKSPAPELAAPPKFVGASVFLAGNRQVLQNLKFNVFLISIGTTRRREM